jgi:hypothetical protein
MGSRVEEGGAAVGGLCLSVLGEEGQGIAEVAVRVGVCGVKPDGFAAGLGGLWSPTLVQENGCEVDA